MKNSRNNHTNAWIVTIVLLGLMFLVAFSVEAQPKNPRKTIRYRVWDFFHNERPKNQHKRAVLYRKIATGGGRNKEITGKKIRKPGWRQL